MAEPRWQPSQAELEQALQGLGGRLAYPPTPDLAFAVRQRLAAQLAPRRGFWSLLLPARRPLALAMLGVLLLATSLMALLPDARGAVAERLGLRGVTIEYLPPVPGPTPVPVGTGLNLGELVTLAEARELVGFQVLRPAPPELADPDEVYLSQRAPGGQVALVYLPRPDLPAADETGVGLLLMQFPGDLALDVFGKGVGPGTIVESVSVNGNAGYWIEGEPHLFFFYRDPAGVVRDERARLAANVLLWEQDGLTLRLESALSKDEALRIAESVR